MYLYHLLISLLGSNLILIVYSHLFALSKMQKEMYIHRYVRVQSNLINSYKWRGYTLHAWL